MTPICVTTGSRLHFGLLQLAQPEGPSFGGLGMMIASPRCEIEIAPAREWSMSGPESNRAAEFAARVLNAIDAPGKPAALDVRVRSAVPQHRGLGGGTQLALAVAAAIRKLLQLPPASAEELAVLAGRGQRSAVGAHGFLQGGLIWESGRLPDSPLGTLAARVELSDEWRVVLASPRHVVGLNGDGESAAFATLPPVDASVSSQLVALAEQVILPAAEAANCLAFGEAVWEFGRRSGEFFAPIQGGAYASPEIAAAVAAIRTWGVPGAGQSSWGPTVFTVCDSDDQAQRLAAHLRRRAPNDWLVEVTRPKNRGAEITCSGATTADSTTAARSQPASDAAPLPA